MALKTLYATFEAERAEQQHQDLMLERILGSDVRDAIMEAAEEEEDTKETKRDKTGHKEEESKEDSKKDAKDSEGKEESKDDEGSDEEATEESFFLDEDAILNYVGEADEADAEVEPEDDAVTEAESEETEDEATSDEDEALEALIDSIPETDPSECGDCAPIGSIEEALIFDEIDRLVPDTVIY